MTSFAILVSTLIAATCLVGIASADPADPVTDRFGERVCVDAPFDGITCYPTQVLNEPEGLWDCLPYL